jgi:NADH-quinone oxidoreductase subunit L
MAGHYHGALAFALHGLTTLPFWLAMAGVAMAWYFTLGNPQAGVRLRKLLRVPRGVLEQGYGFDAFNSVVFAAGGRGLGRLLWRLGDALLIDGLVVNGAARVVGWTAGRMRLVQTGYLYHYSFAMIIGVLVLLSWFVLR